MLNKLYRKLNIIFVISIMTILSCVLISVSMSNIKLERTNESTFFQRMSMLLIYQVEDDGHNFQTIMKAYEEKYGIYVQLQDVNHKTLYQSSLTLDTDVSKLLAQLSQQSNLQEATNIKNEETTMQGGIFELKGTDNDSYLGIPAKIISKSKNTYFMSFLYSQETALNLIIKQLPFYSFIWLLSLLGVLVISRLLLAKAFQPTENSLKSQKDFIASASHELKTPLSILLANVEKIEHLNIHHEELNKSLAVMDGECVRMSKLIQSMLILASSDSKTWTLKNEEIDVDTLLINLYDAYDSLCIKHQITLNMNLSDCSYPKLYTDKERLFQILCIFMDNAICHAENNFRIDIQTDLTCKNITFFVADHGNGISEKDKPYIFDRFYCSDKSHSQTSNFGLGLSIADELAKMLNGKIGVNDTIGGGAAFYVMIPL